MDAMDDALPELVLPPQQLQELTGARAEAPPAPETQPPVPDEVVERMVLTSRDEVEDLEVSMAELLGGAVAGSAMTSIDAWSVASPAVEGAVAEELVASEELVEQVVEDVVLTSADSVEDLVLPMEQVLGLEYQSVADDQAGVGQAEVVEEVVLTEDDVVEEVVMDLQEVVCIPC